MSLGLLADYRNARCRNFGDLDSKAGGPRGVLYGQTRHPKGDPAMGHINGSYESTL